MRVAFTGYEGSGKSLAMTVMGAYWAQDSGIDLAANYHIKGYPYYYIDSWKELMSLKNCIVLLSEFGRSAESRVNYRDKQEMEKNRNRMGWIVQSRKHKILLMYDTQDLSMVEKRVRIITTNEVYVQYNKRKDVIKMQIWQLTNSNGRAGARKKMLRELRLKKASRYWDMYDSYEYIGELKD